MVDAYRQPYIPFYLVTEEFFALVREHLTPGRRADGERGAPGGLRRPGEGAVRDHAHAFRYVLRDPSERVNTVLVASDAPISAATPGGRATPGGAGAGAAPDDRPPGPRARRGDGLTHDRAPVEWLIDASIVKVAANGESGRYQPGPA